MKPLLSLSAVVFGTALAATILTAPAAAAPSGAGTPSGCRPVVLPTIGNGAAQLYGGDPSGRYLLGQVVAPDPATNDYTYTPVVWTGGRVHALDKSAVQPAVEVDLVDANRHGVFAGQRIDNFGSFHMDALTYHAGRYTLLPPLNPGDVTIVTGINDRGDVVGYDEDQQLPAVQFHAVVWPADRPGTVRELSLPGQPTANILTVGIDEDGTVLAELNSPPGAIPYIFPAHGAPYQLAVPAGLNESAQVAAIRDGLVVGTGYQADNQAVGVRWNLRTHRAQVIPTSNPAFQAVNSRGEIASAGAVIHRDGRTVLLDPSGATLPFPKLLTDSGTVAGNPQMLGGVEAMVWLGC